MITGELFRLPGAAPVFPVSLPGELFRLSAKEPGRGRVGVTQPGREPLAQKYILLLKLERYTAD